MFPPSAIRPEVLRTKVRVASAIQLFAGICLVLSPTVYLFGDPGSRPFTLPIVLHCFLAFAASAVIRMGYHPSVLSGVSVLTLIELIRGCIVPTIIQITGQANPAYRSLGTYESAALVLHIGNVFFLSFLVASVIMERRRGQPSSALPSPPSSPAL